MKISIFQSQNYRMYLKTWINNQEVSRGLLSKLALKMNSQNSHLTRVLREEEHLTPDQAYEACRFMNLTDSESYYFLKLVSYERAANPNFKKQLLEELNKLKEDQENLTKRFKVDRMGQQEKEMTYYSAWYWSAIHILTEIPKFQTAKAIAVKLGLDEKEVKTCLQTLEAFNLVMRYGDSWKISSGSIHLPKSSPMLSVQHGNWRAKAVTDSQNKNTDGLHFTAIQAISLSDFDYIKQLFLKCMDDYRAIANKSPSEELICFSLDFFKL